jgi:hypothetical protein
LDGDWKSRAHLFSVAYATCESTEDSGIARAEIHRPFIHPQICCAGTPGRRRPNDYGK